MPPGRAIYFFGGQSLLGDEVAKRFPSLGTDIEEAGKCLGCGRATAAVFHLMRVLEGGVQEFGVRLEVTLLDKHNCEKSWNQLIEQADKAIRALEKGDPDVVALAQVSALLYAVKLAWRNEVMHPKALYTDDEAEDIFRATKAFMNKVVEVCPAVIALEGTSRMTPLRVTGVVLDEGSDGVAAAPAAN